MKAGKKGFGRQLAVVGIRPDAVIEVVRSDRAISEMTACFQNGEPYYGIMEATECEHICEQITNLILNLQSFALVADFGTLILSNTYSDTFSTFSL